MVRQGLLHGRIGLEKALLELGKTVLCMFQGRGEPQKMVGNPSEADEKHIWRVCLGIMPSLDEAQCA